MSLDFGEGNSGNFFSFLINYTPREDVYEIYIWSYPYSHVRNSASSRSHGTLVLHMLLGRTGRLSFCCCCWLRSLVKCRPSQKQHEMKPKKKRFFQASELAASRHQGGLIVAVAGGEKETGHTMTNRQTDRFKHSEKQKKSMS